MDEIPAHHIKQEYCYTRPTYRNCKKLKAVKVYTCMQESKYLVVTNIPSVGSHNDLVRLFKVYGNVLEHKMLDEYPCETFCDTMLIKFEKIQNARIAKIKLDEYNYLGGCLHVCYAPEFESIDELREKINERQYIVAAKCKKYEKMKFGTIEYDVKRSRKLGLSDKFKKTPKKNQIETANIEKKQTVSEATNPIEENPVFDKPELPPDWIKESITGEQSYDASVKDIRAQLKTTIPDQQEVINDLKKKRKRINL